MEWTWRTVSEKNEIKRTKLKSWRRKFAWWPAYDFINRKGYWMQFIWVRATQFHRDENSDYSSQYAYPTGWEIRGGGRQAPNIKECPPNITPSKV